MDHIETAILNCYGIREAEQNMVFAARLTQHGHTIQNMADLMDLYHQSYSQKTVENIAGLPHPTVQKFMVITVAVVGASRRFLTQITNVRSTTSANPKLRKSMEKQRNLFLYFQRMPLQSLLSSRL